MLITCPHCQQPDTPSTLPHDEPRWNYAEHAACGKSYCWHDDGRVDAGPAHPDVRHTLDLWNRAGIKRRSSADYPKRDITPEHSARGSIDHDSGDGPIHADIVAAYGYVDRVRDTADYPDALAWHGWALREAFLAGISHASKA